VRRQRIVEEERHQIGARPGDQRVAVSHLDLEIHVGLGTHRVLQAEDRTGIDTGDLPAKAGRGHHETDTIGHERLQGGGRGPTFLTKQ
jgi:hypothetical protein